MKPVYVFYAQVLAIYAVILVSLFNLTWGNKDGRDLWISLLSSAIGYLLPPPYYYNG